LWLGLGFLARAPVLLAFPLTLALGLQKARNLRDTARFLLLLALGMAPALLGQAAYNWARFGSPLEFGYRWMNSPGALLERQATWGQFSLHFVPENLYTLLMLPLVALRGLAVSDIAFSVAMGALNVALFYAVLSRLGPGDSRLCRERSVERFRIWLCLLLGLGTPLWYCAALGSVWYTAHVVAITCLCLYALEALGQNRPVLAGLWLGLGFLARAPVLLAFPLTLALGLQKARNLRDTTRFLLLLALGMAPALMGQAAYNWARFGSPLEFGYRWMNSPGPLLERQVTWGQFSLHFVPENLYTLLIRPPLVALAPLRVEPDPWGMGLLLTCPALLLVLSPVEGLVLSPKVRQRFSDSGRRLTQRHADSLLYLRA
jgi:hypothetical protein